MSIEITVDSQCKEEVGTCNAIDMVITAKDHDLGGFSVRRLLPAPTQKMIGPWIFFDHMGPANFLPGKGIDVRPHPHINLATVTYLFKGQLLHRDSLGNELTINPGEVNLMVAGRGIVHSERQSDKTKAKDNQLDGLQLWLALPESHEEIAPEFHHYSHSQIPTTTVNDVSIRVLIGSAYDVASPVKTFAETLYIEANLKKGQSLALPTGVTERGLYIVSGKLALQSNILTQHSMTILHPKQPITVIAKEDTQLALIGGETLSRRYIWWNFVSSRKDRIKQAKEDWSNGVFPKVPGDEEEFIPLPEG